MTEGAYAHHMNTYRVLSYNCALVILTFLTGCLSSVEDEQTYMSPVDTVIPSITVTTDLSPDPMLTPTSSSTLNLGPTQTSSPTRIPASELSYPEDDYLFIEDSGCRLPCWSNLQIGKSNLSEFHRVIRETLDFSDANIAAEDPLMSHFGLAQQSGDVAAYSSRFSSDSYLWVLALASEDTGLLRTLIFHQFDPSEISPYPFHTPQTILRLLGEPTAIYTEFIEAAPNAPIRGIGRVIILYQEGLAFFTVHEATEETEPYFCLDQPTSNETVFIMEPFSSGLSSLNELQSAILWQLSGTEYLPSEIVFEMTPAEITLIAQTEDNACLQIK